MNALLLGAALLLAVVLVTAAIWLIESPDNDGDQDGGGMIMPGTEHDRAARLAEWLAGVEPEWQPYFARKVAEDPELMDRCLSAWLPPTAPVSRAVPAMARRQRDQRCAGEHIPHPRGQAGRAIRSRLAALVFRFGAWVEGREEGAVASIAKEAA